MAEKLLLNENFTPCSVSHGDELFRNGIFEFNITKMLEYIQKNQNAFLIEEVNVRDFPKEFSSINEAHIDSVELTQPVILAEISPGTYNLIDGNHRMEKARRMSIKKVNGYRLTVKQHLQFLTDINAYKKYIEYWNGKL